MVATAPTIRFKTKLLRPADVPQGGSWSFLVLPKPASAKLPRRGRTTVEGTLNGRAFRATLEPDGAKSHWLKVSAKLRAAAGVADGDVVPLEIASIEEPRPRVPADLRKALAAAPEAKAVWSDITPVAQVDWIHWIESAKKAETRAQRVAGACDMLAQGKRRVCCFDPSGVYGGGIGAPRAADS